MSIGRRRGFLIPPLYSSGRLATRLSDQVSISRNKGGRREEACGVSQRHAGVNGRPLCPSLSVGNVLEVGAPGVEPGTSCTPCKRASRTAPRPAQVAAIIAAVRDSDNSARSFFFLPTGLFHNPTKRQGNPFNEQWKVDLVAGSLSIEADFSDFCAEYMTVEKPCTWHMTLDKKNMLYTIYSTCRGLRSAHHACTTRGTSASGDRTCASKYPPSSLPCHSSSPTCSACSRRGWPWPHRQHKSRSLPTALRRTTVRLPVPVVRPASSARAVSFAASLARPKPLPRVPLLAGRGLLAVLRPAHRQGLLPALRPAHRQGLLPVLRPAHRQGLPLPRRSVPHPTTALTPVLAAPQAPLAAGVSCVACPARPTPQLLRPAARLPLHQHSRPRAHQRRPGIDGTQAMGDPGPTV